MKWLGLMLLLATSVIGADQCVWYGQCGKNPATDKVANCVYSGPAKALTVAQTAQLGAICPQLVEEIGLLTNGSAATCCDGDQITALSTQMAMGLGMLQSCPSCVHNFRQTFCYMTCAPDQSKYMTVAATQNATDTNTTVISQLNFTMSESFADGVYSSCKGVSMPSTNERAMSLMCGPWGSFYCSPQRWFTFMGSISNNFAPFDIIYEFVTDNRTTQFSKRIVPCQEKATNTSRACSCMDCEDACPVPAIPNPVTADPLHHVYVFAIGGSVVIICWFFLMVKLIFNGNDGSASTSGNNRPKLSYRLGHRMVAVIRQLFVAWGTVVGRHPWAVIVCSLAVAVALSGGVAKLVVTTDPVELWAAPASRSRLEKQYFDDHFQPFYRTEMLIVRPVGISPITQDTPDGVTTWGPVFNKTFLSAVADLQNHIQNQIVGDDNSTLADICFKPLSPANDECVIQSLLNYFQNEPSNLDKVQANYSGLGYDFTYLNHIEVCFRNPVSSDDGQLNLPCLATFGGPVFPYTAVGGFLQDKATDLGENPAYTNATALVITFVVNNNNNKTLNGPALEWEKQLLSFLGNFSHPLLDVAYTAERAIQDELQRESQGDVFTILISYLLMFTYIAISIGRVSGCSRVAIDSKVTLGLCGVLIVLLSVTSSVGVCGLAGLPATLIIIEVIPFLVLAVGVDNMFLLVRGLQRAEKLPTESRADQLGRVLGDVAPALLISTASEAACFFLGALSPMPAVRAFALYAGLALTIDFLLQMTAFLAILCLDNARQESNRLDVLCCIKLESSAPSVYNGGLLERFMKNYYGPFLCKKSVKVFVILVFSVWTMTSVPFLLDVEVGLDQELSMPEDSYLLKYFSYLSEYLSVGPPVYFVLKPGLEFGASLSEQNKVCGGVDCNDNSLVTDIFMASRIANYTHIARPTSSWIDDYISWSMYNMGDESVETPCCQLYDNGTFCPSTSFNQCQPCDIQFDDSGMRPTAESFNKYLPFFLEDIPGITCPKAGHAAYGNAVNVLPAADNTTTVGASYFMTYHTILRTSRDYYEALAEAREIAQNISSDINKDRPQNSTAVDVFPYSVFYVFYEQYLDIYYEAAMSVFVSIATVFLVMLVFSGFDWYSTVVVTIGLLDLLINMAGCMYWFNVSLNAVSLVNIIMSVGIFVEFLSHMVFGFANVDHPDPDSRMVEALVETGTAVLSGITLTKIVGVSVLAFAHSQIFKVFYFRMYLFIVVLGATRGLVWMPVMLSIVGQFFPTRTEHSELLEDYYTDSSIHQRATETSHLTTAAPITAKQATTATTATIDQHNPPV